MDQCRLSEIALKGVDHYSSRASNAATEEEKKSLLLSAEASQRLAEKLKDLQGRYEDIELLSLMSGWPEHSKLVEEREYRFRLVFSSLEGVPNGSE